jgi:hypothetical protein
VRRPDRKFGGNSTSIALLLAACSGKPTPRNTAATYEAAAPQPALGEVAVGKYGTGCRTYAQPQVVGEASYSVRDIGKTGVPNLTAEQRTLVRRIQHYIHSKTLRFTFLWNGNFLVFDATDGPCADFAPGYWVLNDKSPNTFYEPGEAPGFVHAIPGDAAPTLGPWMRSSPPV